MAMGSNPLFPEPSAAHTRSESAYAKAAAAKKHFFAIIICGYPCPLSLRRRLHKNYTAEWRIMKVPKDLLCGDKRPIEK